MTLSKHGSGNVRSKLNGLHWTYKTLADGSRRTYYYAWNGGPRICGKNGKPLYDPDAPEFRAAFDELRAPKIEEKSGPTMQVLLDQFTSWTEFTKLSDSSKRNYRMHLKRIEDAFGDLPLKALNNRTVRAIFYGWRDDMADKPRTADYAWMVLARLLSVSLKRGLIDVNPCEKGGRLYESDRIDKLWQEEDLAKLFAVCSAEIFDAVMLALWTGQRQGDLLKLTWFASDGKQLRVSQGKSKGKRRVIIPIGKTLADHLANIPRVTSNILNSSLKQPWTSDGFRTSFFRACERAGIEDLTFHDLRGTAVTRLAIAGCSPAEIASITGHSGSDVNIILDRHYLSRDVKLAEHAIEKLERSQPEVEKHLRPEQPPSGRQVKKV